MKKIRNRIAIIVILFTIATNTTLYSQCSSVYSSATSISGIISNAAYSNNV